MNKYTKALRIYIWTFLEKEASNPWWSRLFSFLLLLDGLLPSSDETSSSGSDEPNFLTMRCISADSWRVTNVLLVTTTMGMVYGVHSHTSNSGPWSALCLVLVELATSLAYWLVRSASTSAYTDHSSAVTWDGSSAAAWESDSSLGTIIGVTNDDSWSAGGSGERASVSSFPFTVRNDGSFREKVNRQDIAYW